VCRVDLGCVGCVRLRWIVYLHIGVRYVFLQMMCLDVDCAESKIYRLRTCDCSNDMFQYILPSGGVELRADGRLAWVLDVRTEWVLIGCWRLTHYGP
jgi:hypothetical protein